MGRGWRAQTGRLDFTSALRTKFYSLPDEKGVVAAPENALLLLKLRQAHASIWEDREAAEVCTRAIAMAPDNAALYLERGHRKLPLPEAEALPPQPSAGFNDTEARLRFDTVKDYFPRILEGHVWITWGFVGAETEILRLRR